MPSLQRLFHQWPRKTTIACFVIAITIFATLFTLSTWCNDRIIVEPNQFTSFPINYSGSHQRLALNETLGFSKMFVINLDSRPDKRAEMAVLGAQYNLQFDFIPGIKGEDISNLNIDEADQSNPRIRNEIGAHRAHTKLWTRIIQDNLTSALIFEDDVDFDVDIRHQLGLLQGEWDAF